MKIIQGKYKGFLLKGFDINGTRPTMDRVKESLFAMIQNDIQNKTVLDLFAGSGNLGIEALSMGALDAVFVDKNFIACKIVEENLQKVGESRTILKMNYIEALRHLSENYKFDIIFLDPPYQTDYIEKSLLLIFKYNLLNKDGLIVCETTDENKIKLPCNCSFHEYKKRKYGEKIVVILKG